jgi:Uma2 family endonuclease
MPSVMPPAKAKPSNAAERPFAPRRGTSPGPMPPSRPKTAAELIHSLGGIPASRIRIDVPPGQATEKDVLRILDTENRICEIVDGTLVEKSMGYDESCVSGFLLTFLNNFLLRRNLGIAAGPDGTMKLVTGLLRIPDVSFVSWDKLPGRKRPKGPIPSLTLDLAVEVLSRSNRKAEMKRKVREYFDAGIGLVWLIDPRKRNARVFTSTTDFTLLTEGDSLDGGAVLPGFRLPLRELFAVAMRGPDA